jgi:L-fucose isomerase
MGLPTILMGNDHPGTASTVGLLGAGGALAQIGYPHLRLLCDFEGEKAKMFSDKAVPFIMAAVTAARLKGKTMGFFGGRSLGIDTGSHDSMQYRKLFGVDTDHVDQLEIIRRAELVETVRVEKMAAWLTGNVSKVLYDEKLTEGKLAFQIRCYLATKDIITERAHDFVAIKCMPDLTNHYVPQCLSAAFLPSPFDADGAKEPVCMGCEADADGVLTMEILKDISGGVPPMFGDVSGIDIEKGLFYIPNCGAICSWYATRTDSAEKNLNCIELRAANRPAGGAIPFMKVAPGKITLARLYRKNGAYFIAIVPGDVITPDHELYDNYTKSKGKHQLPTAFVKTDIDFGAFIDEYGANHISAVAGHYVQELIHFCNMMNITPVLFHALSK